MNNEIYIRDCDGARCQGDSLEPHAHTYKPLNTPVVIEKKEVKKVSKVKKAVKAVKKAIKKVKKD